MESLRFVGPGPLYRAENWPKMCLISPPFSPELKMSTYLNLGSLLSQRRKWKVTQKVKRDAYVQWPYPLLHFVHANRSTPGQHVPFLDSHDISVGHRRGNATCMIVNLDGTKAKQTPRLYYWPLLSSTDESGMCFLPKAMPLFLSVPLVYVNGIWSRPAK